MNDFENTNNDFPKDEQYPVPEEEGNPPAKEDELLHFAKEFLSKIQESETLPDGVPNNPEEEIQHPDLYSFFESMTALRQEISLQGRSFHQLEQTLNKFAEQTSQESIRTEELSSIKNEIYATQKLLLEITAQNGFTNREQEKQDNFRKAIDYLIEPLLDTHDQFRRLEEQHRKVPAKKHWFSFRSHDARKDNLHQTISLTFKKLNQRLDSIAVSPIAHIGIPFDPRTMKAVEMEDSTTQEPNTIIEIFRQGYIHEDRVIRFAEVKVATP